MEERGQLRSRKSARGGSGLVRVRRAVKHQAPDVFPTSWGSAMFSTRCCSLMGSGCLLGPGSLSGKGKQ